MSYTPKIRLYVNTPLSNGSIVELAKEQVHYLKNVMRKKISDKILLFNGEDGEWEADIIRLDKKSGAAQVNRFTRPQNQEADIWLIFAKVKREACENIIQKATELGATQIFPVITEFTNAKTVNTERFRTIALEAAEQCERLSCPIVHEARSLTDLLQNWDKDRKLMFCDESGKGMSIKDALTDKTSGKWAILIGPEGGFSPSELATLHKLPYGVPVGLGPRILRADTAVTAALTGWQIFLGDWKNRPNFK